MAKPSRQEKEEVRAMFDKAMAPGPIISDAERAALRKPPLVTGFGVQRVSPGKYLAVRLTTLGGYEVLTPKRHGGDTGESKALAWQRALEAAGELAKRRDS